MQVSLMDTLDILGYPSNLLHQMLALQTDDILCDVRLTSQGGGVSAHRIVLMAASPYLKTKLSAVYQTGRGKDLVHFGDISLNLVERVVKYLYTGKLEVCPDDVEQLEKLCEDLELEQAVEACKEYMKHCRKVKVKTLDEKSGTEGDVGACDIEFGVEVDIEKNGADVAWHAAQSACQTEIDVGSIDDKDIESKSMKRRVQKMPCKILKPNVTNKEEKVKSDECTVRKSKRGRPPNKQHLIAAKRSRGRPKKNEISKGSEIIQAKILKRNIKKESNIRFETETVKHDTDSDTDVANTASDARKYSRLEDSESDLDENCAKEIRDALSDLGKLTHHHTPADSYTVNEVGSDLENERANKDTCEEDIHKQTEVKRIDRDIETSVNEDHKTKIKKQIPKSTIVRKMNNSKQYRKNKRQSRHQIEADESEKPKKKTLIKIRRQKTFPCSTCSKILSSHKRLMFHEFSKHGAPYDTDMYTIFPCKQEDCTYVAANRHNLDTHMKSRHGVDRPHICEFCGKAFKLPNVLATHLNIHTGKKLWNCEQCGEKFNQQSGLDVHIKRHHIGEASWGELCHLCSEKFLQKSELVWHLFKTHDVPLPAKYKAYICEICNYLTKSSQDLERHENAHKGHGDVERGGRLIAKSGDIGKIRRWYVCDICGYKSRKGHDFVRHTNAHAGIKQFTCPICQKSCSTKSELKRHVRFHGEKSFKCTFQGCTYACVDTIGLSKHVKLMHTHKNFKPFMCPVCPYRTGVKGNVDKHIRTVHNLDVVTKHTVHLKMKYAHFQSGDIITKDGRLVATAEDRKKLEERQSENEDKGVMDSETAMSVKGISNLSASEESKDDNMEASTSLEKIKTYSGHSSATLNHSYPPHSADVTVTSEDQSHSPSDQTCERYLTSLSNYVYTTSVSSTSPGQIGMEVVAQDLRMSLGNQTTTAGTNLYQVDQSGGLFLPAKYDYEPQE